MLNFSHGSFITEISLRIRLFCLRNPDSLTVLYQFQLHPYPRPASTSTPTPSASQQLYIPASPVSVQCSQLYPVIIMLSNIVLRASVTRPALASLRLTIPPTHTRAAHTDSTDSAHISENSASYIAAEHKHGAHNYHPIPVVIERAFQTRVWDVDGREYLDFLAAYSAVNQGHCHPKIIAALSTQAAKLSLTSRAFHNNLLGVFQRRLCETFGYERALPMNTGVEGGETAIKLARRWGYDVKRIATDRARVVFARGNFWGRTLAAISSSTDPTSRIGFGPFLPGVDLVDYDNLQQLEMVVSHPDVCAFMVEPIQGEAGVLIPSPGYLRKAHEICKKHNVLLIADEVQTGLGRTGTMLAAEYDGVKPDIVVLGKALSGGLYPISAVLGSDEVLGLLRPGQHGSTYGGNPLACAVGMTALDVLEEEGLCDNSIKMGEHLRNMLQGGRKFPKQIISEIRGRGLMNAVVIKDLAGEERTAWEVCMEMARNGVLAKPTHGHIIRLTPPLCISKEEVEQAALVIREALRTVASRYGADDASSEEAQ